MWGHAPESRSDQEPFREPDPWVRLFALGRSTAIVTAAELDVLIEVKLRGEALLREVESELRKIDQQAGGLDDAFKQASNGVRRFGSQSGDIRQVATAANRAGDAARAAAQSYGRAASASEDMGRSGVSAFQNIARAAGGLAIGAVVLKGFKDAAAGAMELQSAVAAISTIKPEIDTSQVFASLNEMSTRVPQSAAQLADSLYNIFSSIEVSQAEALQLVEQFARGATAAQTDAATFGTAVIGVMNAYKLSVADASHISDVFFKTVQLGVVSGAQLAGSLGPVTQSAKAAGVSLDELGGFIAGVTKEGGDASENINNLNNLFQKITTTDAQKELNNLGVATVDSTGKFRPMADILADLKVRLGGMTEAARANALQTIFPDAQARIGAQTIISQLDFVNKAIAENKAAVGTTEAAYAKMSATASAQMTILKNTVTATLTELGAKALPHLTPLITALAEGIPGAMDRIGEAVRENRALLEQLGAVALATGKQFAGMGGGMLEVLGTIAQLTQGFLTLPHNIGLAAVAATGFVVALNALARHPVVAVVIGLSTAVGLLADKLDEADDKAKTAAGATEIMRARIEGLRVAADPHWMAKFNKELSDLSLHGASAGQQAEFLRKHFDQQREAVRQTADEYNKLNTYVANGIPLGEQERQRFEKLAQTMINGNAVMTTTRQLAQGLGVDFTISADGAATVVTQLDKIAPAATGAGNAGAQLSPLQRALSELFNDAEKVIKALRDITNPPTGVEVQLAAQIDAVTGAIKNLEAATVVTGQARADFIAQSRELIATSGLEGEALGMANGVLDAYSKGLIDGTSATKQLDEITKPHVATLSAVADAYESTRKAIGSAAESNIRAQRGWSLDMDQTKGKVKELEQTVIGSFNQIARSIEIDGGPAGLDLVQTYGEGITDGKHVATAAMVGVVGAVREASKGDLSPEGLALALGVARGIDAGTGAAVAAARRLFQAVKAEANQQIVPGSPSKVYTALALTIPQGVAAGIEKGTPTAVAALTSMGTQLITRAEVIAAAVTATLARSMGWNDQPVQGEIPFEQIANFRGLGAATRVNLREGVSKLDLHELGITLMGESDAELAAALHVPLENLARYLEEKAKERKPPTFGGGLSMGPVKQDGLIYAHAGEVVLTPAQQRAYLPPIAGGGGSMAQGTPVLSPVFNLHFHVPGQIVGDAGMVQLAQFVAPVVERSIAGPLEHLIGGRP
jgi:TP901 family phage tail tape measure protein